MISSFVISRPGVQRAVACASALFIVPAWIFIALVFIAVRFATGVSPADFLILGFFGGSLFYIILGLFTLSLAYAFSGFLPAIATWALVRSKKLSVFAFFFALAVQGVIGVVFGPALLAKQAQDAVSQDFEDAIPGEYVALLEQGASMSSGLQVEMPAIGVVAVVPMGWEVEEARQERQVSYIAAKSFDTPSGRARAEVIIDREDLGGFSLPEFGERVTISGVQGVAVADRYEEWMDWQTIRILVPRGAVTYRFFVHVPKEALADEAVAAQIRQEAFAIIGRATLL